MPGIKNSLDNLFKSDFYRNIAGLFSGMFVARLVPAAFAVIIARIYIPADFGIFMLYLTIASVLSIVTTGKFENAIVLVESTVEKKLLFRISQRINTTINGGVILLILAYLLIFRVRDVHTIFQLLSIPFYAFFFSAIQLIRNVFVSKKQFMQLTVLEIARAILTGVLQCLFFMLPGFGLLLGAVLAQGFIYGFYSRKVSEAVYFGFPGFSSEEKELVKRYIDFPKYSIVSEVFNFTSSQLPVFMVKPFFGANMLGLYSFSHRYVSIPIQLLSTSISSVYMQKSYALQNKPEELGELTYSLFKKQVMLGVLPFTVLGLWGSYIFKFVFGAEWEFSGYLAQLIAPWLFAVMMGSPLSSILIVAEKQKFSMNFNITLLVFRAVSLLVGGWFFKDIAIAIGLYSFIGFVFFVILTAYSLWLANVRMKKTLLFIIKVFLIAVVPLILLKLWL